MSIHNISTTKCLNKLSIHSDNSVLCDVCLYHRFCWPWTYQILTVVRTKFADYDTTGVQGAARVAQQAQEVPLMMVSMTLVICVNNGFTTCDPTNCALLGVADIFTAWTMSSRQPMLVLLYCCFSSPKHQSGANFVCPTGRNDILTS